MIDSALYLTLPVKPFDFTLLLTRQGQNPKPKEQGIKIGGLQQPLYLLLYRVVTTRGLVASLGDAL